MVAPNSDVDMPRLKRRSQRLIWMSAVPFMVLCQASWLSILLWQGWPEVPIASLDRKVLLLTSSTTIALSNIPDLLSILVYLQMVRHFRRKKSSVQPSAAAANNNNNNNGDNEVVDEFELANFGGIWVGSDQGSIESGASSAEKEDSFGQLRLPGQATSPPLPPPPIPLPPEQHEEDNAEEQHRVRSVMKVLRWHAALCLADAALVLVSVMACTSPLGQWTYHVGMLVTGFWIPVLLVRCNFKQLQGSGCCRCTRDENA